ncbi:MAG: class I SAM-dependent methyltransferase [Bacteroidales bacterium]|nr:class I SAM-dependent methyltransferase [Bacteroidales bacterium]
MICSPIVFIYLMNYYRMAAALRYFTCSRHRKGHGIHSPFVYDFINNVLRKETPRERQEVILSLKKLMKQSKIRVRVNDLGGGSAYMPSADRRLSDISRKSSVHKRHGRILFNLAYCYDGQNILEMGTSVGISALYMALGAPSSRIISLEGCNNLAEIAKKNFSACKVENIDVMTGDFGELLPIIRDINFRPSMVFVDGNHTKKAALNYFAFLKELITRDSVIIFDDINYSFEMNEAWNEIKSDSQVSVSIDIFQMGMVFFHRGMVKQDFVIRY